VKWFRRRRRRNERPFDASELPPIRPLSVVDAVEEGLMLADYASRLRLRNTIVVGALTEPEGYDPTSYRDAARQILERLIRESNAVAERLAAEAEAARRTDGRAAHAHDYQSADFDNLSHRQAVALELAKRLSERRDDEGFLLELIERARQDAWGDVSRAVEDSLDRSYVIVDADYERDRAKRMRLVAGDLTELAKAQR
jgi:hypothetical protein